MFDRFFSPRPNRSITFRRKPLNIRVRTPHCPGPLCAHTCRAGARATLHGRYCEQLIVKTRDLRYDYHQNSSA